MIDRNLLIKIAIVDYSSFLLSWKNMLLTVEVIEQNDRLRNLRTSDCHVMISENWDLWAHQVSSLQYSTTLHNISNNIWLSTSLPLLAVNLRSNRIIESGRLLRWMYFARSVVVDITPSSSDLRASHSGIVLLSDELLCYECISFNLVDCSSSWHADIYS